MKFEQYNKAIDVLVEVFDIEEDKAINIVSTICDIFELEPVETEEEILAMILDDLLNQ